MKTNGKKHPEYLILSLSRKKISLLKVVDSHPVEIEDEMFPMIYHEDYEYSKSALGSSFGYSLKAFEKDKSVLTEVRFISFLRSADERLKGYLKNGIPLILAGVKKELADFKTLTHHKDWIVGEVAGSYSTYNRNDLIRKSMEIMQAIFEKSEGS